jgi:beta-lactamase class A
MTYAPRHHLAIPRPVSRRTALRAGSAGVAGALFAAGLAPRVQAQDATPVADQDGLSQEIIEAFKTLPGRQGLKLWAPPDAGRPAWTAIWNADQQLFIASAFKVFVLTEYLRQAEEALDPTAAEPLAAQLNAQLAQELELNESVFSLSSSVFNPPNLTGKVTIRTTLEAMVSHSDNTAADMMLAHIGHERVQAFVDEIGLRQTRIPNSTREFIGYIFGLPDWQATTWAQLNANDPGLTPRPILNDVITMASTPDELVSFYARALQGEFFRYAETLAAFRAILMLADAIPMAMPLGVSAFLKGGSLDFGGTGVLSVAGGMYVPDRWVYYSLIINWTAAEAGSSTEVQDSYVAAARTIFTLVRDRLGG